MPPSTRDRLVRAAIELMKAGDSVSLEAVATVAGVSRATAYRAVSGVPDLLASAFATHAEHHVAELYRRISKIENSIDAIEMVVVYTSESLQKDPVLGASFPSIGMPPHELTNNFALDTVRPIVLRGQEHNEIRSDTDAMDITTWLFDCFARGLKDRSMDETEARRMYRTFFVPAMLPPPTTDEPRRNAAVAQHLRDALGLLERP